MYKKKTKIIAAMLVFMLTITHLSIIKEVLATSLENQTTTTNNSNVEFDAYFVEKNKKVHASKKQIGEENYLYTSIQVKDAGYLKNAKVEIENSNFAIIQTLENKQIAKVEENEIYFNQIKKGDAVEIAIPIQILQNSLIKKETLNKENKIKLTAIYVDGKGNENKIEKEITVLLSWTATKEAELIMQVSKFIPYNIDGKQGLVLQMNIQSNLKNNTLPIKENKIEISVPNINKIKPEKIKVLANTTKATNGDEIGANFTNENYVYNSEENKLTIIVKNEENEENKISWQKEAKDEYIINYIYSKEALNSIKEDGIKIIANANSSITTYAENEEIKATFNEEITLKDQISNLVDFTISTNIEKLSKAQLYANIQATNKIETTYQETITANVALAELTDKIVIEQVADNFITEQKTKMELAQSYIKTITLDKKEVEKILGQEPTITILSGTEEIAKIDKNTKETKEGKYIIDLSKLNTNNIKIETSKPEIEGKLNITIEKAIKGEIGYNKIQIKDAKTLELTTLAKAVNGQTNFVEQNIIKEIELTEPTSLAELKISNNNLSTVVTNQNVKLTAILKTDTLDCMLYHNPTIQITMPNYIENINIKNIEVLFDTENSKLKLKSQEVRKNADGTKTIIITLEGMQTEYTLASISKGVNIVITTDITVNKFTSNKQDKITMTYTNNNVITKARTATQEIGQVDTPINIVAPVGVITTNTIANYKEQAENITSISGEEKVATIPILSEARNATFSMEVINNYNNTIDNIVILGRTLFKGNKDIETLRDLGTTTNVTLTGPITLNNVDSSKVSIYYSENGEATTNINTPSNAWTLTPTNFEKVKSYLIILKDHTMNTADSINFNYVAQIPANLQHNESAYENYIVYFNNNLETGMLQDKQVATKVGLTTGRGPVIEANITSNIEETEQVISGEIIKYTLSVKNTGTEIAQNVEATLELPNHLSYVEEDKTSTLGYKYVELTEGKPKLSLGNLQIGQTVNKEIWVKTLSITQETQEAQVKAKITSTGITGVETNTQTNIIKKSYYRTTSVPSASNQYIIKENATYKMLYTVKSTEANNARNNTIISINLPEELTYKAIKLTKYNKETKKDEDITKEANIEYNKNTRILTISIGQVDGIYGKELEVETTVGKLPNNVYEKEIQIQANIKGENIVEEKIKTIQEKINKPGLEINYTSSIPNGSKIAAGEDFKYVIEVKNLSNIVMNNITLTDILPKELAYKNAKITYSNGKTNGTSKVTEDGKPIITLNLEAKESAKVEIGVIANIVEQDTKIENKITIEQEEIAPVETNIITHTIEKYDVEITNPEQPTLKRITGQVWKDENNDGKKEETEGKISNVEVLLFNNQTGKIETNSQENAIKTTTDANGTYTFTGVEKGKYTIIFLYDTANYSATAYRKENIDESQNSDAIDTNITLDGITRLAAITEEIIVEDTNIYNIDLGLVVNPKFDLKLDKTVSKITVQDSKGTNIYEFKDSKLAKRELETKQINNTTIIVEYKIKVTNEGAISGFVKKIADYMPSEMKFNSELNKDWYTSENGILFNASLANTIINPGESKEVTLTLTKKMTENNLGLYHNEAEIYESYNDLGIKDIDSTPGNKISNEDDISSADVLISIKTGETAMFIGLSLTIITTIAVGAYFVYKKVLR